MDTEFEVNTRIVFWGDKLNPSNLANILGLKLSYCTLKCKGEMLVRGNGVQTGSFSKTGRLGYTYTMEFPESKYNPEEQFEFIEKKLKKLTEPLYVKYQVESAELQVFVYYENKSSYGCRVDFILPEALLLELCRHQIAVRITVLP